MSRDLARFFDLFERVGGAPVAARLVREVVSEEAYRALVAERLVVRGARAESLACAHRAGCEREVRDTGERGAARFFAVCGQTPPECDPEPVSEAELETVRIDLDAVVKVVRRLFGVKGGLRLVPPGEGERAGGEPIALGVQEGTGAGEPARDAFFAPRPATQLGGAWIGLRERAARRGIVLVPTASALGPERMARHASDDRVEIVALEDVIGVRDGGLVVAGTGGERAGTLPEEARDAANDPGAPAEDDGTRRPRRAPLRKTRGIELPPVTKWSELRVCLLDGETVRFDGAGKYVRCTLHDLGMASKQNRKATRAWDVLVRTCVGEGRFEHRVFDRRWDVARRHVSDLGRKLQALFGIWEVPFEEPKGGEYRAKFRAREGVPEGG